MVPPTGAFLFTPPIRDRHVLCSDTLCIDSDEVKEWMKELEGFDIPDLSVTVEDAMCDSNPEAKAAAEERGWWTCAPGLTRDTDIISE